jgi:hypothetical protein
MAYELKRMNYPGARSRRGILPALIFLAFSGEVHPTRRRTRSSWAWVWKRCGKGSEDMAMALRSLRMDRKGAGKRRKPSARKLIIRKDAETKGRYSVC